MRSPATALIVSSGVAVAIGGLTAISPVFGVAAAFAVIPLWLLTLGQRLPRVFLGGVVVILVGYAFAGRGFAYAGVPPVFIGDAVLFVGVLTLVVCGSRIRLSAVHWALIAFMALGLMRTLPYIQRDGVNAFRDGVLWGYGLFALVLSAVLEREHFAWMVRAIRRLIPVFIACMPILAVLGLMYWGSLPKWPISGQPILHFKGDVGVHLAGVAAFILLGLYSTPRATRTGEVALWSGWLLSAGIVTTQHRGGGLALAIGVATALVLRAPASRRIPLLGVAATMVAVLALINPQIDIGKHRNLSIEQVRANAASVFGKAPQGSNLEANKDYRTQWWGKIWGYTVHGQYFWTGKGFGINLADDDGFQTDAEGTLRAPHNSHVTVLARMGVPGLGLWIVLQLAFAGSLVAALRRARRRGAVFWAQIDGFLLVYWLASMVNTSFDPYLEGPQGGIWFWSVFGLGLAAMRLQREPLADPTEATAWR